MAGAAWRGVAGPGGAGRGAAGAAGNGMGKGEGFDSFAFSFL